MASPNGSPNTSPNDGQNLSLQPSISKPVNDKKEKLIPNTAPLIRDDIDNIDNANTNKGKNYRLRRCCWFTCGGIFLLFTIQLTFVPHLINQIVKNSITDAFVFTHPEPDNSHYQTWLTNKGGVPIRFAIQFFNVTNPDQVLLGQMPNLSLTGPLVYDQYFYRRDVNFSDDGEYVNHTFFTEYLYNHELSKIDRSTKLTVLSPLVSTLYHMWNVSREIEKPVFEEAMKEFAKNPNLLFWRNETANDLIWTIYNFSQIKPGLTWGFMKNQSKQFYVLHTGKNDGKRMGEVQRWCRDVGYPPKTIQCLQNETTQYVTAWDPPMPIKPGHLFYEGVYRLDDLPDNERNNVPPLWIDILFRNIYMVYNKTHNFKDIELFKYGIQFDPQLLNASLYPPNAQYNQFGPSGLLNSSAAYGGISLFLGMVLFYGAPDYLANNSKLGIPDPGPYDYPYIDIEPKTGAVFYANASMQICTPMHSLPNITIANTSYDPHKPNLFNLTDDMMIPIWLVTFSDEVPDDIANSFKNNINLGDTLHTTSIVVGWVAVLFLIIWSFVTIFAGGVYYHGFKMRNVN